VVGAEAVEAAVPAGAVPAAAEAVERAAAAEEEAAARAREAVARTEVAAVPERAAVSAQVSRERRPAPGTSA
jgi:hypothetical protein